MDDGLVCGFWFACLFFFIYFCLVYKFNDFYLDLCCDDSVLGMVV